MGTVCVDLFEKIRPLIETMLYGRSVTILDKYTKKVSK
jgi:hypothetical protein